MSIFDNLDAYNTLEDPAEPARERFERLKAEAGDASERYIETCPKCRGTGRFGSVGRCFTCKGKGQRTFATSAATRAKARATRAAAKEMAVRSWIAANADLWAWIVAKAPTFAFAAAMRDAVQTYGELTERQTETVVRLAAQDKERAAKRATESAARAAAAPVVSTVALESAFAIAREKGIRYPKLPLTWLQDPENPKTCEAQTFTFKTSAKGPIYVTEGDIYLGKITEGRFFRVNACSDQTEQRIAAICADPKQAAFAYGRRFGVCCKCGRTLTKGASIDLGIGPICAQKYGWA